MLINMDVRATELPHGCRPTHSPQRDLTWLRRGYTVVLHMPPRRTRGLYSQTTGAGTNDSKSTSDTLSDDLIWYGARLEICTFTRHRRDHARSHVTDEITFTRVVGPAAAV